jgi:hypothetical protein
LDLDTVVRITYLTVISVNCALRVVLSGVAVHSGIDRRSHLESVRF